MHHGLRGTVHLRAGFATSGSLSLCRGSRAHCDDGTSAQAWCVHAQPLPRPSFADDPVALPRPPGAKMISAVQFVHARGLLHLDIKPVRKAACLDRLHRGSRRRRSTHVSCSRAAGQLLPGRQPRASGRRQGVCFSPRLRAWRAARCQRALTALVSPLPRLKIIIIDFGLALEVSHEIKKHCERVAAATAAASAVSDAVAASAPSAASAASGGSASHSSSDCSDRDSAGLKEWFFGSPAYASRRMLVCEPASYRDGSCHAVAGVDTAPL